MVWVEIIVQIMAAPRDHVDRGEEKRSSTRKVRVGQITGSQPGQLCHLGDSGQCLETFLVVTTGWEEVLWTFSV